MEMEEVRLKLSTLRTKADTILKLLGEDRLTAGTKTEVERLARELKEDLRAEFNRVRPQQAQRSFTKAESAFYWPSIHGGWVAISGLRVDGHAKRAWYNSLEETRYRLGKHL